MSTLVRGYLVAAVLVAALAMIGARAMAQSAPEARLAFDVVSVKPGGVGGPVGLSTDPGRLLANGSLKDLIHMAYGSAAMRIEGVALPAGSFAIDGRVEGRHTRPELLRMLRAALEDRFQLAAHSETRAGTFPSLVVGPGGAKLHAAADESGPTRLSLAGATQKNADVSVLRFEGRNVDAKYIAWYLGERLRSPLADATELQGSFDFDIDVPLDSNWATDRSVPVAEVTLGIYRDLAARLGLRVETRKTEVEVLVVDRAELPSEN